MTGGSPSQRASNYGMNSAWPKKKQQFKTAIAKRRFLNTGKISIFDESCAQKGVSVHMNRNFSSMFSMSLEEPGHGLPCGIFHFMVYQFLRGGELNMA